MSEKPERKRAGRPPKVAGGMSEVLFVRAPGELLDALDALVSEEKAAHPGRVVSRADIARELLTRALEAQRKRKGWLAAEKMKREKAAKRVETKRLRIAQIGT